jgi:ketosteroid isomerase-like protein
MSALVHETPEACVREYFAAYNRGDSKAYADTYVFPALIWYGAVPEVKTSHAETVASNDAYTAARQAEGMTGSVLRSLRVHEITAVAVLVEADFLRLYADGRRLPGRSTYTVIKTAQGWKIGGCFLPPG